MVNNIYYFTASWCGPCKSISNSLGDLNEIYKNINFYKIDVDDEENNDLCDKYEIKSVPTFLFFKDGKYIKKIEGANITLLQNNINEYFLN